MTGNRTPRQFHSSFRGYLIVAAVAIGMGFLVTWGLFRNEADILPDTESPTDSGTGSGIKRPTDIELTDWIVRDLDWGNIAFDTPSTMRYEQSMVVELLLSPSLSIAELQEQLGEKLDTESAKVRISNRMEARLEGSSFTIEALTPGLRAVTSIEPTQWKWEVTPNEYGTRYLYLTVFAHVDVAQHDLPVSVRVFNTEIDVQITMYQRASGVLSEHWPLILTAVLIPSAAGIWTAVNRKRRRSRELRQRTD